MKRRAPQPSPFAAERGEATEILGGGKTPEAQAAPSAPEEVCDEGEWDSRAAADTAFSDAMRVAKSWPDGESLWPLIAALKQALQSIEKTESNREKRNGRRPA
ncbi:MAG: hypothetical protein WKG00_18185 [Polyangiaceae bacterium]